MCEPGFCATDDIECAGRAQEHLTYKHQEHHTLTTLNVLGAGPRTIAAKFAPPLSSSSCVADALATASYQQQEHHV